MAKRRSKLLELVHDHSEYQKPSPVNQPSPKTYTPHSLVHIKPETEPQEQFIKAFYSQVPIIVQAGTSGCGKTFVSVYAALNEIYDKNTPYDKLIIVRSAVQSRNIGFLKGTEDEKNESYENIYKDMFDSMHVYKSNNYKNLKELGKVEFHNTSFLRGKTFDRAIICVDELQNLSYSELYTIVTRIGEYSKIVFCGDFKQTDLKGTEKNGFHDFLKVIKAMPREMSEIIYYTSDHVLRSEVVKSFIMAEEKVFPLTKID